ncbi:Predicted transcriptional regulator [Sporobacter termitidis DSM 10068]|uniref:Predicted transcriptional regulator n=1 Tax=Sporobacter termitidis DSM 10068 TaxID=1123282 RepID=A0A1M5WG47_9FIRM|nr:BlaI/MecI/CopY family transcriptional regulator [Sporobacter termitidis]SHH86407.1 Predicted transcriptional regulator [Sporobacter termitidis DSM 10068]
MSIKLFDSELNVMNVLWRHGTLPASQIAQILKAETGWNRNTTYTIIKKCIEKDVIERTEPNFVCRALVSREEAQEQETNELIDKMFSGSEELFFTAFLSKKHLSDDQLTRMKVLIESFSEAKA